MGTKGRRLQSKNTEYEEPKLLSRIQDIVKLAEEKNLYHQRGMLDIESLIHEISEVEDVPISIRYEEMDQSQSGSLNYESGGWIIRVNSIHNKKRQRFTLAHELGHYILHKNKTTDFRDTTFFRNEDKTSLEYMANDFASALLMPDEKVKECVKEGIRKISDLADKFEVSSSAMRYKVERMGYKIQNERR